MSTEVSNRVFIPHPWMCPRQGDTFQLLCSGAQPGCVQPKAGGAQPTVLCHHFCKKQPGCLSEKDAVLCYQRPVEDVCCAVQPQPRCIPRRRRRKMQHPSTYIISTCQGFTTHLSGEKSSLLHIFKLITS